MWTQSERNPVTDFFDELNSVDAGGGDSGPSAPDFIGGFGLGYIAGRPPTFEGSVELPNGTSPFMTRYAPSYVSDDNLGVHDEWGLFADASAPFVGNVQADLVRAGYLGPEDIENWGAWGRTEASAMKRIMETANGSNRSWQQVLGSAVESGEIRGVGGGSGGSGRIAPTIRLTNADDLRATFRQVARQTTGGVFVEDDQIDAMVESYHQKERDYQRALAGGGGETEGAPSAGTFAAAALEEVDPGGATANRFAAITASMINMARG